VKVVKVKLLICLLTAGLFFGAQLAVAVTKPASSSTNERGQAPPLQVIAAVPDASVLVDASASPILETPIKLSPGAFQLAEQLGIGARIQKLDEFRRAPVGASHALELVETKQAVMHGVLIALLQVRATSAQIANDIFEAGQIRNLLEGRRDRVIKLNTLANLASGGVAEMAGGALQLIPNQKLDNAGNIIEMIGGGLQSGLSLWALRQQEGARLATPARPNMLAPILDQNTNQDSKYPIVVWKFLNTIPPEGGGTRRQLLVKQWLEYGRLADRDPRMLSALSGNGGKRHPVSIDVLEDRQAMLSDVNAVVSRIDKQLLEILLYSDLQSI